MANSAEAEVAEDLFLFVGGADRRVDDQHVGPHGGYGGAVAETPVARTARTPACGWPGTGRRPCAASRAGRAIALGQPRRPACRWRRSCNPRFPFVRRCLPGRAICTAAAGSCRVRPTTSNRRGSPFRTLAAALPRTSATPLRRNSSRTEGVTSAPGGTDQLSCSAQPAGDRFQRDHAGIDEHVAVAAPVATAANIGRRGRRRSGGGLGGSPQLRHHLAHDAFDVFRRCSFRPSPDTPLPLLFGAEPWPAPLATCRRIRPGCPITRPADRRGLAVAAARGCRCRRW